MLKIGSYLLFALSLLLLSIPSIIADLLGASFRYGLEIDEIIFAISWFSVFSLLSYSCYRLSKIKEMSFSFLFFLFPIQIFIISGVLNLLGFNDNGMILSAFITLPCVFISLTIYQLYKKRNSA